MADRLEWGGIDIGSAKAPVSFSGWAGGGKSGSLKIEYEVCKNGIVVPMSHQSMNVGPTRKQPQHPFSVWHLFFLAFVLVPLGSSYGSDQSDTVTIATARGFSLGKEVSVRGFITVPPSLFASFTGEQGFAIEDSTGGIYVQLESAISLQLGKEVRVSGRLAEIAKLTVISSRIELIEQLSQQVAVQPADITTRAVSAATEGRLVRIQGTITRPIGDDRPYGYKIFLDDGSGETQVFVPVSTGIDPLAFPGLQVGRRLAVIGFSGRFNDTYELIPRFPTDLAVASP